MRLQYVSLSPIVISKCHCLLFFTRTLPIIVLFLSLFMLSASWLSFSFLFSYSHRHFRFVFYRVSAFPFWTLPHHAFHFRRRSQSYFSRHGITKLAHICSNIATVSSATVLTFVSVTNWTSPIWPTSETFPPAVYYAPCSFRFSFIFLWFK